jgi:hypothetical protein
MEKKKILILVLGLLLITGLSVWAFNLNENKGKSDTELFGFNIEDTSRVDRIIITDAFSNRMALVKNSGVWTNEKGECIIQNQVKSILEAVKNIEFKGYVKENSKNQHIKMMSAQYIKAEFFVDGDWTKSWYIGTSTQDHYGQVMLLESEAEGKSDLPVLMKIKGFNGIIEPRFFADPRKWQCTQIFSIPIQEVKMISVTNHEKPNRSFSIKKSGFNFTVKQNGKLLDNLDTATVFRYLQNYQKIHFEMPNYLYTEKQVDSLKRTQPFITLRTDEANGKSSTLKCYRVPGPQVPGGGADMDSIVEYDTNRFWCVLPSGKLVKCQYFVFDPLFRGDLYFPMNK